MPRRAVPGSFVGFALGVPGVVVNTRLAPELMEGTSTGTSTAQGHISTLAGYAPLSHVSTAVDNINASYPTATNLGSASSGFTPQSPYIVMAVGHAAANTGVANLQLLVGGTSIAICSNYAPYGAINELDIAMSGMSNMACVYLARAGITGGETLQWSGWAPSSNLLATSMNAVALDLTNIPENNGWWYTTSNDDTSIFVTPTSGWTNVATALTFTPTRSGNYTIVTSSERVGSGAGAATDMLQTRVTQDGVAFQSSYDVRQFGTSLSAVFGYMTTRVVQLTAGQSYTFQIQGNNTGTLNNAIGYRRSRIFALENRWIVDPSIQQGTDNTGFQLTTANDTDVANFSLNTTPTDPTDCLFLGSAQMTGNIWGCWRFLTDGADSWPSDGFGAVPYNSGLTSSDDLSISPGLYLFPEIGTIPVQFQGRVGASAGGGNELYFGNGSPHTDAGELVVVTIPLATEFDGLITISGSSTGATTNSVQLIGYGSITATVTGAATESAQLVGSGALIGTSAGAATNSAQLVGSGALAAAVTGAATNSAQLVGTATLSATVTGAATESAQIIGIFLISGTVTGTTAESAQLVGIVEVSATVSGTTTESAQLIGVAAISATATGTTAESAQLIGSGALLGSSTGSATESAQLVGSGALVGVSTGLTTNSAQLTGVAALITTVTGTSDHFADLIGLAPISGESTGTSDHFADLINDSDNSDNLQGIVNGTSSATGALSGAANLVGQIVCTSAEVATLVGIALITGSAICLATNSAQLTAIATISATTTGAAVNSAQLTGSGILIGTIAGVATDFAQLIGIAAISGTSIGGSSATGDISLSLSGTSIGGCTVSGTISATGQLTGVVICLSSSSAGLRDPAASPHKFGQITVSVRPQSQVVLRVPTLRARESVLRATTTRTILALRTNNSSLAIRTS